MRYLKRYNENKEDLKELIETHLSYLLDNNRFRLEVDEGGSSSNGRKYYIVKLYKLISVARDIINWDSIKADIIPMLHFLSSEYDLINFAKIDSIGYEYSTGKLHNIEFNRYIRSRSYGEKSSDYYIMSADDVINDEGVPEQFYSIKILVWDK